MGSDGITVIMMMMMIMILTQLWLWSYYLSWVRLGLGPLSPLLLASEARLSLAGTVTLNPAPCGWLSRGMYHTGCLLTVMVVHAL